MDNIGFRIKSLRQKRNLSQKEFSERVCISQSYLSRVETGKEQPTDMLLKLIALELTCSFDWLLRNQGEMEINDDTADYWDRGSSEQLKNGAISDIIDLLTNIKNNMESGISISISNIVQLLNYLLSLKNTKKTTLIMEEFTSFAIAFYDMILYLETKGIDTTFSKGLTSVSQEIEGALHDLYISQ